ncbi:Uncharacterised protein [Klebsiella pneumoniae]|nr:Uncharacterised protein [Klebsiella pneumoniae]
MAGTGRLFDHIAGYAAARALKTPNHQRIFSVFTCNAKRHARKQGIFVITQPQRTLALTLCFTGVHGINVIAHAIFSMKLNNGLFLRPG